jgi:hypothetical protein
MEEVWSSKCLESLHETNVWTKEKRLKRAKREKLVQDLEKDYKVSRSSSSRFIGTWILLEKNRTIGEGEGWIARNWCTCWMLDCEFCFTQFGRTILKKWKRLCIWNEDVFPAHEIYVSYTTCNLSRYLEYSIYATTDECCKVGEWDACELRVNVGWAQKANRNFSNRGPYMVSKYETDPSDYHRPVKMLWDL